MLINYYFLLDFCAWEFEKSFKRISCGFFQFQIRKGSSYKLLKVICSISNRYINWHKLSNVEKKKTWWFLKKHKVLHNLNLINLIKNIFWIIKMISLTQKIDFEKSNFDNLMYLGLCQFTKYSHFLKGHAFYWWNNANFGILSK